MTWPAPHPEIAVTAAAAAGAVVVLGTWGRDAFGRRWRRSTAVEQPVATAAPGRRLVGRRLLWGIAAVALLVVLGPAAAALALTGFGVARAVRPVAAGRRHRRAVHRALPDAIDRIVLLVHAGLSPHLAVVAAAGTVPDAVRPGFEAVVHRLGRGAPFGEALDALTDELGIRASPLVDAFAAADRYGLPLEPILDQLAHDARNERRRLDEADARRLPVRLSFPLVTCTLPSFVLIAIAPAVLAALSSLGTSW